MSANVIVYSTSGCSECNQVKQLLESKGIPFEVRDVMTSSVYQEEVEKAGLHGHSSHRIRGPGGQGLQSS
ncbi:glutaredoxin family protein [Paenibacillus rhizoplanae]